MIKEKNYVFPDNCIMLTNQAYSYFDKEKALFLEQGLLGVEC